MSSFNYYLSDSMTNAVASSPDDFGRRFLDLPRELRDRVYFFIIYDEEPLDLTNLSIQFPLSHSTVSSEWLEAVYTHRVCRVTFSDPELLRRGQIEHSIWGPSPQHKRLIQRLIVNVSEVSLAQRENLEDYEYDCVVENPEIRQEWLELLDLPRLETLKIEMQKTCNILCSWANFSPILCQLREETPKLNIEFHVSFDKILRAQWEEYMVRDALDGEDASEDGSYKPMGFANVSDFIASPTAEDREVAMLIMGSSAGSGPWVDHTRVDITRGLLDETPEGRRQLAPFYIVKEPALARVLIAEHYEIYKRLRREREEKTQQTL
jgi:hypothetical protein